MLDRSLEDAVESIQDSEPLVMIEHDDETEDADEFDASLDVNNDAEPVEASDALMDTDWKTDVEVVSEIPVNEDEVKFI